MKETETEVGEIVDGGTAVYPLIISLAREVDVRVAYTAQRILPQLASVIS